MCNLTNSNLFEVIFVCLSGKIKQIRDNAHDHISRPSFYSNTTVYICACYDERLLIQNRK